MRKTLTLALLVAVMAGLAPAAIVISEGEFEAVRAPGAGSSGFVAGSGDRSAEATVEAPPVPVGHGEAPAVPGAEPHLLDPEVLESLQLAALLDALGFEVVGLAVTDSTGNQHFLVALDGYTMVELIELLELAGFSVSGVVTYDPVLGVYEIMTPLGATTVAGTPGLLDELLATVPLETGERSRSGQ